MFLPVSSSRYVHYIGSNVGDYPWGQLFTFFVSFAQILTETLEVNENLNLRTLPRPPPLASSLKIHLLNNISDVFDCNRIRMLHISKNKRLCLASIM